MGVMQIYTQPYPLVRDRDAAAGTHARGVSLERAARDMHGIRPPRRGSAPQTTTPIGEGEATPRVIGSRYRADQWASYKATHNPPYLRDSRRLCRRGHVVGRRRDVAVHVASESKVLKPVALFIGSRVETRGFQAMGQLHSTCTGAPNCLAGHHRRVHEDAAAAL
jgi:hypothetical protein